MSIFKNFSSLFSFSPRKLTGLEKTFWQIHFIKKSDLLSVLTFVAYVLEFLSAYFSVLVHILTVFVHILTVFSAYFGSF